MIDKIRNFFHDEEDDNPSFISLVRNIVIFVIIINIAILPLTTGIVGEESRNPAAFGAIMVAVILEGISLYLVTQNKLGMAKIIVPLALIAAVTLIALTTNGLKSTAIVGVPVILVVSAILLGRRFLYIITPISVVVTIFIGIMDVNKKIRPIPTGIDDAIIIPVLLVGCSAIIQLLIARLNESTQRARESERVYIQENRELTELRQSLELRVNLRTTELENANKNIERRARQFEAVAQVASVISNIQDLESLLPRITQVISEQFGHYHTGIFLLDDVRQYAVLRAANSVGGQRMLQREHKLLVGQTGIVGFVTATGQPRIALDVGADAVFFDNPDLPSTHSEIALPLRVSNQVIGALDVQSEQENAFKQDDISALVTLADQVSIAIQNTLILEEARKSLAEAQSTYGGSIRDVWNVMRSQSIGTGLQWVDSSIKPLDQTINEQEIQKIAEQGKSVIPDEQTDLLMIPIRIREKIIGVMSLKNKRQGKWNKDEIDIAEAVADRLSLAIETASLLRTAQNRASIERATSEIAAKVGSSTRFETILKTAAQELSKVLGGADVLVQIEPTVLEMNTPTA